MRRPVRCAGAAPIRPGKKLGAITEHHGKTEGPDCEGDQDPIRFGRQRRRRQRLHGQKQLPCQKKHERREAREDGSLPCLPLPVFCPGGRALPDEQQAGRKFQRGSDAEARRVDSALNARKPADPHACAPHGPHGPPDRNGAAHRTAELGKRIQRNPDDERPYPAEELSMPVGLYPCGGNRGHLPLRTN
jgi:hypothetical protein